jgi:hypothetical protein
MNRTDEHYLDEQLERLQTVPDRDSGVGCFVPPQKKLQHTPGELPASGAANLSVNSALSGTRSPGPLSEKEIQDQEWVDENIGKLAKSYPNKWIAVLNKRVVEADEDLGRLLSSIKKSFPGESPGLYLMEFNEIW